MENAGSEILEAYKIIVSKQCMELYDDYEKQLKEKQSQYDAINEQRKDLMGAKNFEDLKNMVKNIYDHGDTKDYIDPYN
jgi:DnaJ-class molecular chaperone